MAPILRAVIAAATLCALDPSLVRAESVQSILVGPGQNLQDVVRQALANRDRPSGRPPGESVRIAPTVGTGNPTITVGGVKQGTVVVGKANSFPVLTFTYDSSVNPLEGVQFTFTSPNGAFSYTYSYNPRIAEYGGTVVFEPDQNAKYWSQPGRWMLTSAQIYDVKYNGTTYDQAQIAAFFSEPYITVVNDGPVDITPPKVTAGHIMTPKVSLSSPVPTFRATLTGTDDVSGIGFSFLEIEPPGAAFGQTLIAPLKLRTLAGTVDAYAPIYAGQATGTWSITGYGLCDLAGNCLSVTKASEIKALFGTTTFTVTK